MNGAGRWTATVRLLARLSAAHYARHRARVVLTCFGVALGVAAMTAVLALSRSIVSTFEASVLQGAGAVQLQVSNGAAGVDRELVDTLARVPGIIAAGATVQHQLVVPDLARRITVIGVELGRDEAYREVGTDRTVVDISDALTFIARTDSVALSASVLAERRWKVGDTVEMIGPRGAQRLTIRGTLHPKGALEAHGGDVALMDLDAAQLRFGDPDRVHWIDLVVAPDADPGTVRGAVESIVAGRATVASPVARGRRIEAMLSLLRVLLTGTSTLAMLVGIFLIQHTMSTSYRQRRADFVRLRALGLSRWSLVGYLVCEATMLGMLASALGMAAGIGIWRTASTEFGATISSLFIPTPPPRFALTALEFGGTLALGTCAVVAGALTPIVAMVRMRPMAADPSSGGRPASRSVFPVFGALLVIGSVLVARLADGGGFTRQVAVIGAMGACSFLGATFLAPLLLAAARPLVGDGDKSVWGLLNRWTWHQIWRQRLHTATTMGALAAGVALAVAYTVLLGSYRAAFRGWFDQTFITGDVLVNAGPTISLLGGQTLESALGADIERVDGVERLLRWRFLEVDYRGAPIVIEAMSDELLRRMYPTLATQGGVIISDTLAEHFNLRVGDTLAVSAPVRELRMPIAGVVPDYVLHLGTVKLGWKTFVDHFGEDRVSLFGIEARPGISPHVLKSRIDALLRARYDVTVLTAAEVRHLVEQLVDRSIALTYWLQLVAALVAVAAMVNATSASIMDRERELRTWRALGLLRRRLVRLLVGEAALIGVAGSLLGVVVGAVLGFTLTTSIARAVAGYRLEVTWSPAALSGFAGVSILAAACSAAFVALRWTRGRAMTNAGIEYTTR